MSRQFVKRYADDRARLRAENNYRWLASLGTPVIVPELHAVTRYELCFEHVDGRHLRLGDLTMLAAHLGAVHQVAYARELWAARLGQPFRTNTGWEIPSFPDGRSEAVERELRAGHAPGAALTLAQTRRLLTTARGPAAFYKDANPRNFLITASGNVVTVDFDDLTLAPFGYDLAKLIVCLAMTCGPLPAELIASALTAYNTASAPGRAPRDITWDELMSWAGIHDILTRRYAADGRYAYRWHQVRPESQPTGEPSWP